MPIAWKRNRIFWYLKSLPPAWQRWVLSYRKRVMKCVVMHHLVNSRRAYAARVMVFGLLVYAFVSVRLPVTTFSATTGNKTTKQRYQRVHCYTGFIF